MRLLTRPKPVETKSANQNTGQVQTKNIKKSLEQVRCELDLIIMQSSNCLDLVLA